jgi:hypothetical protein
LSCLGGANRLGGGSEGDEEGVALGVDLVPARVLERRAQEPLLLLEQACIAIASQALEQAG